MLCFGCLTYSRCIQARISMLQGSTTSPDELHLNLEASKLPCTQGISVDLWISGSFPCEFINVWCMEWMKEWIRQFDAGKSPETSGACNNVRRTWTWLTWFNDAYSSTFYTVPHHDMGKTVTVPMWWESNGHGAQLFVADLSVQSLWFNVSPNLLV